MSKRMVFLLAVVLMIALLPSGHCFAGPPSTIGLVAWYPFAGNANDQSGNSHNGTVSNAALSTDRFGHQNQAYSFNGSTSYVAIADNLAFNFASAPFAIASWINVSGGSGYGSIFDRSDGAGNGYRLEYSPGTGTFTFRGSTSLSATATLTAGTWYHVVAVSYGDGHGKIYLNGAEIASGSYATTFYSVGPRIGSSQTIGVAPFNGLIDEVRIYNRPLASEEIFYLFNESLPSMSAGKYHACGVETDGTGACLGDNSSGQAPASVAGPFTQVSADDNYTCWVQTDGTVTCLGNNNSGQAPASVAGPFAQVSGFYQHTCGVKTDGIIACWGFNGSGRATPPAGKFTQVSAGESHTCGVKADGTAACWGYNGSGQAPASVAGQFRQVSAGENHTCGVKTDGTVVCWGSNSSGQAPASAAGTYSQVSAGWNHTCGVKMDGTIACWGGNGSGQAPASVAGQFKQVSAGYNFTCAVKGDATVSCWGDNSSNQAPFVSISPATLPNGVNGAAYSQTVTGSGKKAPYTFKIATGNLPAGLSLSGGGLLSGTPTASGTYLFSIEAVDSSAIPFSGGRDYTLSIKATTTTTITSHTPNPSTTGQAVTVNFTVTAAAGTPTGNVTVSDGTDSCSAAVSAGSCNLAFSTAGDRTLIATYDGDLNFSAGVSAGVSHTVTVLYTLTITKAGTGTGNVTINNGTLSAWVNNVATATYTAIVSVDVSASANSCSVFAGWNGSYIGNVNPYPVTMSGNRDLTATFNLTSKVWNATAGSPFALLQPALNALDVAVPQQEIDAQAFNSGEDVTMNKTVTLKLKGGYDCDFIANTSGGKTGIKSLTINNGTLIIENIGIGGP